METWLDVHTSMPGCEMMQSELSSDVAKLSIRLESGISGPRLRVVFSFDTAS